jgi:hypothetical protein
MTIQSEQHGAALRPRGPSRREIAERALGGVDWVDAGLGYCRCPGDAHHTTRTGARDCRVHLEGAIWVDCFHGSCAGVREEVSREMRRQAWAAEHGSMALPSRAELGDGVAPAPRGQRTRVGDLELRMDAVARLLATGPQVDRGFLRRRSPVGPVGVSAAEFLGHVFRAGERVLVFTSQFSQGDFGARVDGPGQVVTSRLGKQPGVRPVASALPAQGPDGVWYLAAPVTGQWAPGPRRPDGSRRPSRRSEASVTSFRHVVLESDVLGEQEWLGVVARMGLAVLALYTSGGKSVHALVRIEAAGKAEFDSWRQVFLHALVPLGADPAAITAVRLTRLPGCRRGDRLQELLYLDPAATAGKPLTAMPEVRA